ncbi:hypothetical protein LMG23994_01731 [Cupriavidus pinatubonensis]|uniref:Uncharacterized protein n=1 Tax=Cupriavidus pinatubonensis TaxID=248026 RepID=A0ABN7Y976_9BURK|nr:hypothetical protein LMG23994_01731 [Cupriavidus pinatubonensis]
MTHAAEKAMTRDELDALPYNGPTKAEREAEEARDFARCKEQATCVRYYCFAWQVKLEEEERAQKCKGRCMCAEVKGRPVAVEFDFELTPGEKTIVTFP